MSNLELGSSDQIAHLLNLLSTLSYRHSNFDKYLEEIACAVSALLGVDWAAVTLRLEDDQEKVLASSLDVIDREKIYSYHGSVSHTVIQTGQPFLVEDTQSSPQLGETPPGYRAYLGVPLLNANNKVIGTICTFHQNPRHFSESETRVAALFAERAAVAIDNFQLYQKQLEFNKRLEQEVAKRTAALKSAQAKVVQNERLAAIGEFSSGIVHEIRTPLSTLSMVLDYLSTRQLDDRTTKRIALAKQESSRLERLLNEILAYAKPMALNTQRVNMWAQIKEVTESIQQTQGCGFELTNQAQQTTVHADPDRMKQMLYNLLKNACEASPPGVPVRATVNADNSSRFLLVEINNQGSPIPEEAITRLTMPFYSTKPYGTGLGLAIVKRILDVHNGSLQIDSSPENGTSVRAAVPIDQSSTKTEKEGFR